MAQANWALVLHAHLPLRPQAASRVFAGSRTGFFQAVLELLSAPCCACSRSVPPQRAEPRSSALGSRPPCLSLLSGIRESAPNSFPGHGIQPPPKPLLGLGPSQPAAGGSGPAEQLPGRPQLLASEAGELLGSASVRLQQAGRLDLMTCAATHGYLPLLRHGHLGVQGPSCSRDFGSMSACSASGPRHHWAPEVRYLRGPGSNKLASLRPALWPCSMATGLLHGLPRPRYGIYAPNSVSQPGVLLWRIGNTNPCGSGQPARAYPGDGGLPGVPSGPGLGSASPISNSWGSVAAALCPQACIGVDRHSVARWSQAAL